MFNSGAGGSGNLFNNAGQQKQGGTGLFQNNTMGGQGQTQQQGGSAGLFGNNNKPQGGSLFGQQQQGGGMGTGTSTTGGLFGQKTGTGTGTGTGSGTGTGTGGGLFGNTGNTSLFGQNKGTTLGGNTSGGLFGGQQQGGGSGGLFGNQGGSSGSLFGGQQQNQLQLVNLVFTLKPNNMHREKKISQINFGDQNFPQRLGAIQGKLTLYGKTIEELKITNGKLIDKRIEVSQKRYKLTQTSREFLITLNQARTLVDKMKNDFSIYEEVTKDFETALDLMKGGRLKRTEIPSLFMINITEYFEIRLRELKEKVKEIEELVKLPEVSEDSDDFDKIIIVVKELYDYFLSISTKVFQLNDYVNKIKLQFKEYFRIEKHRDVTREFDQKSESLNINRLKMLQELASRFTEATTKAKKEQEVLNSKTQK